MIKDRQAYPMGVPSVIPYKKVDIKKWRNMRQQVDLAKRAYADYSTEEIVKAYTHKWNPDEAERFAKWYRFYETGQHNKYKKYAMRVPLKKIAYDFSGTKDDQLIELKRKLRSRVNSIEKLFNQVVDNQLIGTGAESDKKVTYLSRILHKLKEEINTLHSPNLLEAVQTKAAKVFSDNGMVQIANMLDEGIRTVQGYGFPRTTKQGQQRDESNRVLDMLKTALQQTNYRTHLKRMYDIMVVLEKLGRTSDADLAARVIREDLDSLEKMNKRLTEIYTALSKDVAYEELEQELQPKEQQRAIEVPVDRKGL